MASYAANGRFTSYPMTKQEFQNGERVSKDHREKFDET